MRRPEALTLVLVLGLGAAIASCSLLLGGDKDYVDLDATSSASSESTTGTLTTTGETATGAGGAAMTASSSSAGGMTTGQGGSTGTCGQAGCGGAGSTTATTSAVSSSASSSSTGSGGPTPCGAGAPLSDSFTGSTIDSTKWGPYTEGMGSTVAQTNNQIAVFSTGNIGAFAGIYSKVRFPLQGCSASLKVLDAPKIAGLTTFFQLTSKAADLDQVYFTQSGNSLYMEVRDTGGIKGTKQIAFVTGKHVYWRFRESSAGGGTIHWETSDTGAVWEEHFTYLTANLGFPVDQVQVNFGVSANGAAGATVHFDSFNVIP